MQYVLDFIYGFINILGEMAPYLLLGFLFAGLLHVYLPQKSIDKYFGKSRFGSAIRASLFGIPLPLCSCGVIPTGISLFKNGASKGSTVSFLISTPQTGVDSILVTYSLLGLPMAIIRPIVAFFTGVFGGALTYELTKSDKVKTEENIRNNRKEIQGNKLLAVFRYGFVEFMQDISKWLIIGLVLAAVLTVLIPDDFFTGMGWSPLVQMLIVLAGSIPLYICATASVPLAAVLLLKGISPGAALVLLMAGPATNAATITMIGNVLGRKSLFAYLFSIIIGALFFGLIMDYALPAHWFHIDAATHLMHDHDSVATWIKYLSGITLVILIINGYYQKYAAVKKVKNAQIIKVKGMEKIKVEGMSCNHCTNNVESNLSKMDTINSVKADLTTGIVSIEGENVDLDQVETLINSLGYKYIKE